MKYLFLLLFIFCNACISKTNLPKPKFSAGQRVIVLDGFYKGQVMIIESFRYGVCVDDSIFTVIYTGDTYIRDIGHQDIEVCEYVLENPNKGK